VNLTDVWLVTRILGALTPLLLLGLLGVVVYRTGSGYIVLARAWRLVVGRRAIVDRTIEQYVNEQHDLHSFSFFSGLRPKTFPQTLKVIEWGRQHDLDLRHAARCGGYFDIEHMRINDDKLPSERATNTVSLALSAAYIVCAIALGWGVTAEHAYMSFKDDGRLFTLSADEAKAFVGTRPLTLERCQQPPGKRSAGTGFTRTQADTLCAFLVSDTRHSEIDASLRGQRNSILWLGCLLAIPFILVVRWLGKVASARGFATQIEKKVISDAPKTPAASELTAAPQEP
jgi:hypothetical protein